MTEIFFLVPAILFALHALFFATLIYRWAHIPVYAAGLYSSGRWPKISLLIPARNEAGNIRLLLQDLSLQEYPAELWEVIVCDDHSTDNTAELALEMAHLFSVPFKVVSNPGQGKKAAITYMASVATGDYLLCTDADCRCGPKRILSFASALQAQDFNYLYGSVHVPYAGTLAERLEAVETSVLSLTGAATLAAGRPTMSNGANMLFHKQSFMDAGAYERDAHIASGDDEFLLHRMFKKGKAGFIKDADAQVFTAGSANFKELINRRLRWAGKWKHYDNRFMKLLALWVFTVNACVWPCILAVAVGWAGAGAIALGLLLKFTGEAGVAYVYRRYYGQPTYFWDVTVMNLLYPLFGAYVGLLSLRGRYVWKGRTY